MAISADKQILYNIIEREVSNFTCQFPVLSVFRDTITNYIISYIEPYVNAFIEGPQQRLNIEQLSAFTESEVADKITRFKEKYKKEVLE